MYTGLDTWVEFLMYLTRQDVVPRETLLRLADAEDIETIDLLIQLNLYHQKLLQDKAEAARAQ